MKKAIGIVVAVALATGEASMPIPSRFPAEVGSIEISFSRAALAALQAIISNPSMEDSKLSDVPAPASVNCRKLLRSCAERRRDP